MPLDQPNSKVKGFKKTDIEAKVPKDKALNMNTQKTITQAYLGSLISFILIILISYNPTKGKAELDHIILTFL